MDSQLQLSKLKRENPESLDFAISFLIEELVFAINVPQLTESQVAYMSRMLVNEFWYLKIEDFILVFKNAKTAKYGKIYNRIDIHVISSWLYDYCVERERLIEMLRVEENTNFKKKSNDLLLANAFGIEFSEIEQSWDYDKVRKIEMEKAKEKQKIEEAQTAEEQKRIRVAVLRNRYFDSRNLK